MSNNLCGFAWNFTIIQNRIKNLSGQVAMIRRFRILSRECWNVTFLLVGGRCQTIPVLVAAHRERTPANYGNNVKSGAQMGEALMRYMCLMAGLDPKSLVIFFFVGIWIKRWNGL